MAIFIKKAFKSGGLLTVSEVHDREHGSMQVDIVLELRVLHLVGNRKSTDSHIEGNLSKETSKPTPTVAHFLQQGHTS